MVLFVIALFIGAWIQSKVRGYKWKNEKDKRRE